MTLPNRFYQVPHCTGFGVTKPFTQAAHRGMKAEGGWGAVCTEYCSISPTSDDEPYVSSRLWDDDDVASLRLMTEAVHAHGALAGVELWHGGAHGDERRESRLPTLAPSQIANEHLPWNVPQAMTAADIRREQDAWVAAARRAVEAGFDIVYVYGSHSYLPTQFLSSRTTGAPTRTAARSRTAPGSGWRRSSASARRSRPLRDRGAGGRRLVRGDGHRARRGRRVRARRRPVGRPVGRRHRRRAGEHRTDSGASRAYAQGYQLELTRWMRGATAKPMIGVGRYTDPDLMAAHVSSGAIDVIGAARPSIADPFLPAKIRDGRYDEIRECIGCNQCYSRANYARHLGCTQNATAGEEHRRGWHPERFEPAANAAKDVLVVGAGPAGLECAIVLASAASSACTWSTLRPRSAVT